MSPLTRGGPLTWADAVALAAALAAGGCLSPSSLDSLQQEIRRLYPDVSQISPEQLEAWQEQGPPPLIVDTRAAEEYEVSHLAGAHSAPDLVSAKALLAEADADRPVVLYCSVGYRSARLAHRLGEEGFEKIYNLEGSIFRWVNSGRTVVRREGGSEVPVEEVHPYGAPWGRLLEEQYRQPRNDE